MLSPHLLTHPVRGTRLWAARSRARSLDNARLASRTLARDRREREEVAAFIRDAAGRRAAVRVQPGAPSSARAAGRVGTRPA